MLDVLDWTANILTTNSGISPKELILNKYTNSLFLLNPLSCLLLIRGQEGRLKHLRALIKEADFENSKPTVSTEFNSSCPSINEKLPSGIRATYTPLDKVTPLQQ